MTQAIKKFWKRATKVQVVVVWEGEKVTHWAHDWDDALGWLACYPDDAVIAVGKYGRVIAARYN